ncbi:DUF2199 domain-containing protein [Arthrobacter sp. CJ23]|uniref:DUF2199 domain-containing protein n=1 Tax=Arthrobacter sp. CJ23 TaxID=2972479 RepID=UPI00215BEBCC|nr:DUF2199 domain-containing protein [Arthrobacter sp. CJ23]UVJ38979.1 DUF2199 domain-containing protein [Arthrobacter sp. CJ23]
MGILKKRRCSTCGRSLAAHERDVRFQLPDPVLKSPEQHHAEGSWLSHKHPNTSVMMMVPEIGPFVRALLPVRLTEGHSIQFGVWVAIHPDDAERAASVWLEPDYADLTLTGYLANNIEPWGLLRSPVDLAVRNVDHTPYCVSSSSPELEDLLTNEWPHSILDSLP